MFLVEQDGCANMAVFSLRCRRIAARYLRLVRGADDGGWELGLDAASAPCQKQIRAAQNLCSALLMLCLLLRPPDADEGLSDPHPAGTHVVNEIASQPGADVHTIALVLVNGEHGFDLFVDPDLDRS